MQQKLCLKTKTKMLNRFMLSQHMKSVIYALTLPVLELNEWIEKEIETNPLLEKEDRSYINESSFSEKNAAAGTEDTSIIDTSILDIHISDVPHENSWVSDNFKKGKADLSDEKKEGSIFDAISKKKTLSEHLLFQAYVTFTSNEDIRIAEHIIGSINSKGLLDVPLDEISETLKIEVCKIEKTLEIMQAFDPIGVFARSIEESLLLQLQSKKKEGSIAYKIIKFHYNDLIHNRFSALSKKLNLPIRTLKEIVNTDLKNLIITPSQNFSIEPVQPIFPDLTVKHEENKWIISVNDEHIPKIYIQSKYDKILNTLSKAERQCIQKYILQGKWLIKAINSRKTTLEKVLSYIVKKQRNYLLGIGPLLPMNYKDLATGLNLHISTISRAVSNKYVASPLGLVPLRGFFSYSSKSFKDKTTSTDAALHLLKKLIKEEDKKNPMSDEKIAKKIDALGVLLARRTIAKYRKKLKIPSARQRKLF